MKGLLAVILFSLTQVRAQGCTVFKQDALVDSVGGSNDALDSVFQRSAFDGVSVDSPLALFEWIQHSVLSWLVFF